MKNFIYFLLICSFSFYSFADNHEKITINIDSFSDITLTGINKEDLTYNESDNILYLEKKGYIGFENLSIATKDSEPLSGTAHYGVLQYLIDDMPAFALSASFQERITLHKDSNAQYKISDIVKSSEEIENLIMRQYFNVFLEESTKTQREFYLRIVDDKSWTVCCPEYIAQAKAFLGKSPNDFKTLSDLSIYPILKKIELNISNNRKIVIINY